MNIVKFQAIDAVKWRNQIADLLFEASVISFTEDVASMEKCYEEAEKLKSYLEDDKAFFLAAIGETELAGFLWAYPREIGNSKRLHLNHLILRKEFRNGGIGTALMKSLENYVKECRFSGFELMVSKSNEKAISLYQKLGYRTERFLMFKDAEQAND